ncbi:MAG: hypothetical protein K9M94_09780 [Spirochaetia bacterium]|nr:hypothetical protein [Spirochaetia bacterium]
MWSKNRGALSRYQLIIAAILMLCAPLSLFSQTQEAQNKAKTVMIVPIVPQGAPRYTGLLMTKLVEQNFARTEVLAPSVLAQDLVTTARVGDLAEELDPQERNSRLIELGSQQGVRYVAAGAISKAGSNYKFTMIVVDSQQERTVISSEKTAVGLKNVDRIVSAFTDELISAEFPEVVQERVQQIRAEEAGADEELREDLADLEQIAEEDPEEAIKRLPEKVQKAVAEKAKEQAKDEAREEVVQEEIQNLYNKEKEEQRIARARKIQKYAMLSGYGLQYLSNTLVDAAIQTNMRAIKSWSLYMNDVLWMDPYEEYRHFHGVYTGLNIGSYVIGGLGSGAAAYSYLNLRDDVLFIRKGTRGLLAISNNIYLAGRASSLVSGGIGFYSMELYNEYMNEHNSAAEITDKYNEYRDMHSVYEISRYTALSLQTLGAIGITASYFWPGEKERLVLSDSAGFYLGLSNIFSGAGTVLTQVALNLYTQAIESSISANSSFGNPEADPSPMYKTYALTAGLSALAMYSTAAVLSTKAITDRVYSEVAEENRQTLPFAVAVVPAPRGVSVSFEVRR